MVTMILFLIALLSPNWIIVHQILPKDGKNVSAQLYYGLIRSCFADNQKISICDYTSKIHFLKDIDTKPILITFLLATCLIGISFTCSFCTIIYDENEKNHKLLLATFCGSCVSATMSYLFGFMILGQQLDMCKLDYKPGYSFQISWAAFIILVVLSFVTCCLLFFSRKKSSQDGKHIQKCQDDVNEDSIFFRTVS